MTKLHYFAQEKPDPDDIALAAAIARSEVPIGCLLGGKIVASFVAIGKKPCSSCSGPRERCGGDPAEDQDDRERAIQSLRDTIGDAGPIKDLQDFLKSRP